MKKCRRLPRRILIYRTEVRMARIMVLIMSTLAARTFLIMAQTPMIHSIRSIRSPRTIQKERKRIKLYGMSLMKNKKRNNSI